MTPYQEELPRPEKQYCEKKRTFCSRDSGGFEEVAMGEGR